MKLLFAQLFILLFFTSTGCNRPDPSPELKDPIYKDLEKRVKSSQKSLKDAQKKLEGLEKKLARTPPRSRVKMVTQRDIKKTNDQIDALEQKIKYYEIRKKRRKVESRIRYKRLFQQGKEDEWPDMKEYKAYKTHKRLRSAPEKWDARVPKLKERVKDYSKSN